MPYNYFPRGRVELRHGKAVIYLNPTICTPEMYARIRQAFSLPDEMQAAFKAAGTTGAFRKDKHGTRTGEAHEHLSFD